MSDKNDLRLDTVIALDLAFSSLVHNLCYHQPAMANSIARDLDEMADNAPTHLPGDASGTTDILRKWAATLRNGPTAQDPDAPRPN